MLLGLVSILTMMLLGFEGGSASPDQCERVHSFSLCFEKIGLEKYYREYQFEHAKHSLYGKGGSIATTCIVVCIGMSLAYCEQMNSYFKHNTPGSVERMILGLPFTIFSFYYLFLTMRSKMETKQDSLTFAFGFVLLFTMLETFAVYVNDKFAEFEGCPAHKYRCPFSFSSPKFASRNIVFAAMVVFNLTPCMSFTRISQLIAIMFIISRTFGFYLYRDHLMISAWSSSCMCMQISIFLGCRYWQELQDRRKFLLQIHISRLRSNLQELLDSMVPHSIAARLHHGENVIDTHENVAVLLCCFPVQSSEQADTMKSFLLLDQVHQAFDDLLLQSKLSVCKVDFIGYDYMLTSPIHSTSRDDGVVHDLAVEADAQCAAFGRLAARMRGVSSRILAGSGLELRFAVAAGPAIATVIGATRRHLRLVGPVVDAAREACWRAVPWDVLSCGRATAALRAAGLRLRPAAAAAASDLADLCALNDGNDEDGDNSARDGALSPQAAVAAAAGMQRQISLKNLIDVGADASFGAGTAAFSLREALDDVQAAAARLVGDALADPAEEAQFALETAGRLG